MPLAARGGASAVLVDERPSSTAVVRAFDPAAVAGLSCAEIHGMTCEELIRVVRTAPPPTVLPEMLEHLEFQNREILERLAFLTRECCRKRGTVGTR